MTSLVFIQAAVIGVLAGVLAALCGVGGGVIMVPAFVAMFALGQKQAVATSLLAIIVTSLVASIRNHGAQLIDWRIGVITGVFAAVAAWFAAGWMRNLDNFILTKIFAVLMIGVGVKMLFWK